MFGGVGKAGWATILASGVMLGGSVSAQAADLGGDCCADLEERVAELEATTARKGNRKVSLEVYGWVNESVMYWDDGFSEENVYVGTNTLEQTRFGFKGKAKINSEWEAGYKIEIGVTDGGINEWSQSSAGGSGGLSVRKSYWYLKSKKLGELAVGQNGTATYHVIDDADFTNTRNVSDYEAAGAYLGSFDTSAGPDWKAILRGWNNSGPGQSSRRKVVRYDSPSFAGFSVSAAWGEDDLWDVAAAYKGEIGDFKIKAQVGYGESTDEGSTSCGAEATDFECNWFGTGATIMHEPTGLYVYGGYGWQQIDFTGTPAGFDDISEAWFIQAGIEKKWMPLGKTTIFGEYRQDNAGTSWNPSTNVVISYGADVDHWAAGVVQKIDAAAMDLYIMYRHTEGDADITAPGVVTSLEDFDSVIAGSRIQF